MMFTDGERVRQLYRPLFQVRSREAIAQHFLHQVCWSYLSLVPRPLADDTLQAMVDEHAVRMEALAPQPS